MSKAPKLRFKEFTEKLEHYKFKDLVLLQRGSSPRPISKYVTNSEDGVNWIKIGDVSKDSTFIYKTKEKITQEGAKKSRFVGVGDLILSNSMSFGRPYIMGIEGYIHDGWFVLKNYSDNFDRDYLCNLLTSYAIQKQYKRLAAGGVVDNISSELVNSVDINLPSKEEQEKIASFFSLIDDKISLQGEKVEALKDYKKGMMQKIFSRELRFKDDDGRDYPEWEDKKLGDIANITMGQSPSSSCYNEEYIGLPLIQGNADIKDRKTEPRVYTSEITKTCDIGDIIMSVRAPVGAISMSLHNACIGRGVCSIKPKYSVEYVYQFLLKHESKWSQVSQGSTFESVNSNDIKSLKIPFPNLDEQKKIGNFLGNIDNKIEKEQEKLDSLNEYKKGLLQQMFV